MHGQVKAWKISGHWHLSMDSTIELPIWFLCATKSLIEADIFLPKMLRVPWSKTGWDVQTLQAGKP